MNEATTAACTRKLGALVLHKKLLLSIEPSWAFGWAIWCITRMLTVTYPDVGVVLHLRMWTNFQVRWICRTRSSVNSSLKSIGHKYNKECWPLRKRELERCANRTFNCHIRLYALTTHGSMRKVGSPLCYVAHIALENLASINFFKITPKVVYVHKLHTFRTMPI